MIQGLPPLLAKSIKGVYDRGRSHDANQVEPDATSFSPRLHRHR